ncbi:hypothetical protein DN730_15855 [Marinomonas piezotolerans]|uniref:Uncharacterized protein n=2 Tax=Marinomonas piezotolerans TaxID=2213058 RepID=A0A370U5X0_9GAMM|nr:hypothetical protein DN730_15855 [Marinomonas piezotolerans]
MASMSAQANNTELDNINRDTARAYEAYIMTFIWPEKMSSEHIDYESVLSLGDIPKFTQDSEEANQNSVTLAADIEPLKQPFDDFKQRFAKNTHLLANEHWTLIFPETGATISRAFHSEVLDDGYSEFVASVDFTLGRYLESDLTYRHFLFDTFTSVVPSPSDTNEVSQDDPMPPTTKHIEPALELNLNFNNKTASTKLNYIDHPIIGTLIYFEPLELEDAIERISMQQLMDNPPDEGSANLTE